MSDQFDMTQEHSDGQFNVAAEQNMFVEADSSAKSAGLQDDQVEMVTLPCGHTVPKDDLEPCDIDLLSIGDTEGSAEVSCTKPASVDKLKTHEKAHLDGYDLLYEVVCDPERTSGGGFVDAILASTTTPACSHGWHSFTKLTGPGVSKTGPVGASLTQKLYAEPYRTGPVGFISAFWDWTEQTREYVVEGYSCGINAQRDPYSTLKGLIRIHQKNDCSLTLTLPAFAKMKHSKSETLNAKGKKTKTEATDVSVGGLKSTDKKETVTDVGSGTSTVETSSGNNLMGPMDTSTSKEGMEDGADVDVRTSSTADEKWFSTRTATTDEITGDEEVEHKVGGEFGVTITHNNVPLDCVDFVNKIINIAATLKAFFDDLKNWVPQIGWSFDMDIGILEGSITGKWGMATNNQLTTPRLVACENDFSLTFACNIFRFVATISFGVDVGNSIAGGVGKVSGSLGVDTPADFTVSKNGTREFKLEPSIYTELKGELVASVVGRKFGATAQIKPTLKLEVKVSVNVGEDPAATTKLAMEEAKFEIIKHKGTIEEVWWECKVFEERVIFEGNLLED